jgi:hypothetical protein
LRGGRLGRRSRFGPFPDCKEQRERGERDDCANTNECFLARLVRRHDVVGRCGCGLASSFFFCRLAPSFFLRSLALRFFDCGPAPNFFLRGLTPSFLLDAAALLVLSLATGFLVGTFLGLLFSCYALCLFLRGTLLGFAALGLLLRSEN